MGWVVLSSAFGAGRGNRTHNPMSSMLRAAEVTGR